MTSRTKTALNRAERRLQSASLKVQHATGKRAGGPSLRGVSEDLPLVSDDRLQLCFGQPATPGGHPPSSFLDESDLISHSREIALEFPIVEARTDDAAAVNAVTTRAVGAEEGPTLQELLIVRGRAGRHWWSAGR